MGSRCVFILSRVFCVLCAVSGPRLTLVADDTRLCFLGLPLSYLIPLIFPPTLPRHLRIIIIPRLTFTSNLQTILTSVQCMFRLRRMAFAS